MEPPSRLQRPPTEQEGGRFREAQIRQEGSSFGATHATNGATVLQGTFVDLTLNSSTAARPDFSGHFAHAALEPVKAFVPRSLLHDQIHAQLGRNTAHENAAPSSTTKTLVVWGLGGAGKTQLVLDYMHRHRDEYKATFWVEAGSKESLERDIVRLYQTLFSQHASARQETTIGVEDAVTAVKSWFAGQQGPWLMVFDGADTIEDEDVGGYIDIKHFIPSAAALDVIITSRSSTAKDMTHLEGVLVGDMEATQAAELFQKYSKTPHDDAGVADEVLVIVKELGCLALAVTLAATYVGSTPRLQSNIKAYLPEYRQRRRDLLRRKPESLVHQYNDSVLTTWETSYTAVAGQCAEASVLMTILSFLSFDDIYLRLFSTIEEAKIGIQTKKEANMSWKSLLCPEQTVDMYKIEECFAVLQKYSLVQWKTEKKGYTMHQLVHAWGYDRLTTEEQSKYSHAVFELIVEAIKGCGRAPEDKLRLVPHVMGSFAALTRDHNQMNRTTENVLNEIEEVESFIFDLGRWKEAHVLIEYVLHARRRLLGEEHPGTIIAMAKLGNLLKQQGQLDKAVKIQKTALKRSRIFGEEHLSTLFIMHDLATSLKIQGQLDEAAEMMKEVLEKARKILGEDHPQTISAMGSLAKVLGKQGKLDNAVEMTKEVLEKRRKILGEDHLATMTSMQNLCNMLGKQGKLDYAVEMTKEVLEKIRPILGEDHPQTLCTMHNLANMLGKQGQLDKAAEMLKEVLEKTRLILGEDHRNTIRTMENLAAILGNQGQLDEAVELFRKVLERRKRIFGEDHANTIRAMGYLAMILRKLDSQDQKQSSSSQASTRTRTKLFPFLRRKHKQ